MGAFEPKVKAGREGGLFTVSLDWFVPGEPRKIRWAEAGPAYAIFTMAMSGGEQSMEELLRRFDDRAYAAKVEGPAVQVKWGNLALGGRIVPAPLAEQDSAFSDEIDGKAVLAPRLSDVKLE